MLLNLFSSIKVFYLCIWTKIKTLYATGNYVSTDAIKGCRLFNHIYSTRFKCYKSFWMHYDCFSLSNVRGKWIPRLRICIKCTTLFLHNWEWWCMICLLFIIKVISVPLYITLNICFEIKFYISLHRLCIAYLYLQ